MVKVLSHFHTFLSKCHLLTERIITNWKRTVGRNAEQLSAIKATSTTRLIERTAGACSLFLCCFQLYQVWKTWLSEVIYFMFFVEFCLWDERTEKDSAGFKDSKENNEWICNKAGVKWELLDTVRVRKPAYYSHTMKKQETCKEKEIMQGTMPGARERGRPRTTWMDNIKTWTGLPMEESIRMTENRDK